MLEEWRIAVDERELIYLAPAFSADPAADEAKRLVINCTREKIIFLQIVGLFGFKKYLYLLHIFDAAMILKSYWKVFCNGC